MRCAPCVGSLDIDFGPVSKLQYNKAGPLDDVYVVSKDGIGTIGLYAVEQNGEVITFTFNESVCAGPTPGQGHSSYFIGVPSTLSPKLIVAYTAVPGLLPIDVKARAGAAGDQGPDPPATQVSGFASAGAFAYDVSQRQ
jgi:hypothetical protein